MTLSPSSGPLLGGIAVTISAPLMLGGTADDVIAVTFCGNAGTVQRLHASRTFSQVRHLVGCACLLRLLHCLAPQSIVTAPAYSGVGGPCQVLVTTGAY